MLTAEDQEIAARYEGMARSQAWAYFKRSAGSDLDSVMSAAMLGLVSGLNTYPAYCQKRNFDPDNEEGRKGYLLKRIKGAILDDARSADHMTRSGRNKIKAVRAAEDDGCRGDEEIARATGLTVARIRQVRADALMPIDLGYHPDIDGTYSGVMLADRSAGADVESSAVVSDILSSFLEAFDALDPEVQVILALRFHGDELSFSEIAAKMFCSPERVAQLHDLGVCAVHAALVQAASCEGAPGR